MPSPAVFRLSMYLTLALSCVCLGYAEWDLLPEATVLAAVVVVLLVGSFVYGEKYQLDLVMANRVGFAIGLTAAAWLGYQFVNRDSLIYTFPWPASLLPYLGPLLMVLMPAKLSRPVHVGDWWAMHGIALAGAGLASALAEDVTFGLLLGLYAAAALWSLAAFYYPRVGGALPPVPGTDPGPTPTVVRSAGRGKRWTVAGLAAAAVGMAVPAFYLTPRSQSAPWQFVRPRLETGYGNEAMVDLTRTGDLKVNRDVAFDVTATYRDGTPYPDLDPGQRWRGREFVDYKAGKWTPFDPDPLLAPGSRPRWLGGDGSYAPPDLGPGQFVLDFTGRPGMTDAVVADPVAWAAGRPPPVVSTGRAEPIAWYPTHGGSFRSAGPQATRLRAFQYRQAVRRNPPPDEDTSPPFEVNAVQLGEPKSLFTKGTRVDVPELKEWTAALLARLAAADSAVAAALARGPAGQLDPADYEVVARALAGHLAGSGEYRYTLSLKRPAAGADAVADFLMRGKEGHCQRFAAGLVLMLRAAGIPAQYVLGFKGWDAGEGPGTYLIRQEHTHAWAEVLITRPAPLGFPFDGPPHPRVWHWLSLDPSPDGDADAAAGTSTWLAAARQSGRAFFSDFVVGYNAERRQAAVAAAGSWGRAQGWKLAIAPAALTVAFLLIAPVRRRARTRQATGRTARTAVGFYDELVAVMTAAGVAPSPGQTPAEYAVAAAERLRGTPAADAPGEIAAAFYQARYAGRPPTPDVVGRMIELVGLVREALQRG